MTEDVIKSRGWLSSEHIHTATQLIQKAYPGQKRPLEHSIATMDIRVLYIGGLEFEIDLSFASFMGLKVQ